MKSSFLDAIDAQAQNAPRVIAFENSLGESLTYAELKQYSDALAAWITSNQSISAGVPIVVYGHKSPLMLACFFACVKSGHAYVPVDIVYPRDRIAGIIEQIPGTVVFDTTAQGFQWGQIPNCAPVFSRETIEETIRTGASLPDGHSWPGIAPDELLYLLFTSGSTGKPKGVKLTRAHVDMFAQWLASAFAPIQGEDAVAELPNHGKRIWFNRAPFSFDVSVADIAGALTVGDSCFSLAEEHEESLRATFEALSRSGVTDWVSTPSFVDQCLADESFNQTLLPNLRRMMLAGEVLRPETVRLAQSRFPGLRVFNGYGPTEAGFVTLCEITPEMLADTRSLPVGYAKPDIDLVVLNPETLEPVVHGQPGELFLVGKTVGLGYWELPEQTEAGFHSCPAQYWSEPGVRAYRTGDECILEDTGLLYYHGRLDLQVKLHGFRIELGDIEAVLCRLEEIHMACVLPVWRNGAISHLAAFVQLTDENATMGLAMTKQLKTLLHPVLPSYMIPRVFKYIETMPLNPNGKADRKALAALIEA